MAPLIDLLKASLCQRAFDMIKALICNVPVLAAPQWERAFCLEVDASFVDAGAVLLQADQMG